ncbi:MAG: PEPxxWA-CTERM sorting domain-containing protein [Phenylobacterium sp.]|nr:PEPxxWA-CTERM sorting domain-containing protein [Phenylobacterium sp.]
MKMGLKATLCASAVCAFAMAGAAQANVTLQGDYVQVQVNTGGSFSSLKHDPTGNGAPGVNDYITPGTPHDGFSVRSDQTGWLANDNDGGGFGSGSFGSATVTNLSGGAYDFAATWTGGNGSLEITNYYFFNAGDERINVQTTITALQDLTNLSFARSVDPDPDVNTNGNYDTLNQRGNDIFGVTDFIGAAGQTTGLTLALLNLSGDTYVRNTRIDFDCCSNIDPTTVLAGSANGPLVGDYGLNMAWLIGDLAQGGSATINYAYVVGENIDDAGGGVGAIPEPSTWAMMILGFGAVGSMVRRRRLIAA